LGGSRITNIKTLPKCEVLNKTYLLGGIFPASFKWQVYLNYIDFLEHGKNKKKLFLWMGRKSEKFYGALSTGGWHSQIA